MDHQAVSPVGDIFFEESIQSRNRALSLGRRFVHYTSSEVAFSILQNKFVWMRNALTMNDFSEIEHGLKCLLGAWGSPIGNKLRDLLDQMYPGFCNDFGHRFDSWLPAFREETYITCLSEHDADEDDHGRLSMWRAYGGANGVALVLNNTPFLTLSAALKAYSFPVEYLGETAFLARFERFYELISLRREEVHALGYDNLLTLLFNRFRANVLCTKHPGFHEEREWRVVYSPQIEKSEHISKSLQVVRGVPQIIHAIPLKHDPAAGLFGADIPTLLNRIIIGPSHMPFTIKQTMRELLKTAGVNAVEDKIVVSNIPLRQ